MFRPTVDYVERGLDDTTQGALRVGTEGRATFVSEGTLPARPMPPPVLVTWLSTRAGEISTSFHGMSEVVYRKGLFLGLSKRK